MAMLLCCGQPIGSKGGRFGLRGHIAHLFVERALQSGRFALALAHPEIRQWLWVSVEGRQVEDWGAATLASERLERQWRIWLILMKHGIAFRIRM